jgi:hypothetical protein
MAHLRNNSVNVPAYGRAKYHNRHFRDCARIFGLDSEHDVDYGYARTHVNARGERAMMELNPDFSMVGLPRLEREGL